VAPTPIAVGDPGYEVVPNLRPQVLFSDWTPRKLDSHEEQVEIYSNCEQVELFLNGKSLGAKPLPGDASPRTWRVAFEAGTLKAVATNRGRVAAVHELRTAGRPARILLSADQSRLGPLWDDLCYVTVTVVDENGVLVPTAGDLIRFKVSGAGVIAAVDSGDNTSHEL
jgi:beta-galactosidase